MITHSDEQVEGRAVKEARRALREVLEIADAIERRPDDEREGELAQAASHLHAAARALSFGLAQAATFVLEVLGDSDDDIIADEFNTNAPRMLYAIRKVLEVPLMTGMGLPLGIR